MIEKKIIDYLNSNLEANTYMEIPEEKPVRFYIMERTAGGETNHIREGSFSVQSYAPTLYEASLMNNAMINVFKGLVELPEVSRGRKLRGIWKYRQLRTLFLVLPYRISRFLPWDSNQEGQYSL